MSTEETYQKIYTNSWAFIIGINKYKHTSPLNYVINDAKAIADILVKKFKFPKENISLLTDVAATQEKIRKNFHKFTRKDKIHPNDRLLVFFAGHGYTMQGKRGEVGFLVPVDGKPEDIDSLIRWDEFTRGADLIPAKHVFFIMDACYGGLAILRTPSFGNMRFLGDMLQRYTRQALTAGKANETVADGNGIRSGHSIFTAHLLNGLEGDAYTEDGIITANGIMAYVYDQVGRDQYSHQTPHFGFIDGDGDFIFDTSVLNKKQQDKKTNLKKGQVGGEKGDDDILINTSPQIALLNKSKKTVVEIMKELLSDPKKKIELEDFIISHVKSFLDKTDLRHFPTQGIGDKKKDFAERLKKYDEITVNLQQISILLAKWGNKYQIQLLEKILKLIAEADKGSSGIALWLKLNWYPIQLIMYSAGISALSSKNYKVLKIVFETIIREDSRSDYNHLVIPVGSNLADVHDAFKWLPGYEKHYVPKSEYLFKSLQPMLEDLLFLGKSYENFFDTFEILFALEFAHLTDKRWGPFGRFGWKHKSHRGENSPFNLIMKEANKEKEKWKFIQAGLFNS